jgi:hypothetical protein
LRTSAYGAVCLTAGEVYRLDPRREPHCLPGGFDLQNRLVVISEVKCANRASPGSREASAELSRNKMLVDDHA